MQNLNNTPLTSSTKFDEPCLVKGITKADTKFIKEGLTPLLNKTIVAAKTAKEFHITSQEIDEIFMNLESSRYKTKLYMEAQGLDVDEEYKFEMPLGGETKTVYIRHFGYIEVDGVNYSLVGFLEEHFRQKKSTIIRNVIKAFGLGGK